MGWKMKNFTIFGVHGKIQVWGGGGGGGHKKPTYRGIDLKWGGGGLARKMGGVFEGGWYPNAQYVTINVKKTPKQTQWMGLLQAFIFCN